MEHNDRAKESATVATIRTVAHVEPIGHRSGGVVPPVLDGTRPLQREGLSALLRERSRLAANWFVPIQRPDGSFPYTYDASRDRYGSSAYNEVRHAGATAALFQACHHFDDPALHACATRAAEYIVDGSVSVPEEGAAFLYRGRCKLGGQALAIVALLEGRRALATDRWDEPARALGTFLLGMERPGHPGRFFQSYDAARGEKLPTPDSNYYPGEALLALTRLHGAFPDGPWLSAAQRAATYLIRVQDGDQVAAGAVPRNDHWLTIALSDLHRFDPHPDYATIVGLQADRMIRYQYREDDPEQWRIGAGRRTPTPSFPSTATQAEALDAAWALSRTLGDGREIARRSEAALRSVQFLMRVQCTAENTRELSRSDRALGAWTQDVEHPLIRFDFVQHGLSALIGAWTLLEQEKPPVDAPATAGGALGVVSSRLCGRHNVWSPEPVVHVKVRFAPEAFQGDFDVDATRAEVERALGRLPLAQPLALETVEPSSRAGRAFIGALIARAALAMQQSLGDAVSVAIVAPGQQPDELSIVFGYRYEAVAHPAGQLAVQLVAQAVDATHAPLDLVAEWEHAVAALHPSRTCRPEIRSILAAAERRGIPVRSLDPARRMVELGTGAFGRRFWNLATTGTSHHGVKIAKDKHMASALLRDAGLPVPRSQVVTTVAEAMKAAAELGYPVVLKPNQGSQGRDVFVDIQNDDELATLGHRAFGGRRTGDWLVEQYVPGNEHRVLVIGGQVVAVNLRTPATVTGDGSSTVRELIDRLNADPARSFSSGFALKPVVPGAQQLEALRRQGLSPDSVPEAGRPIRLNSVSNVSAGGSARDVTDRLHPDNARIACMAAELAGLDFAGIDLVAPEIGQSILETGGGIIEINSHPGVIDHLQPFAGTPRDVGMATLAMLYPEGHPVRARIVVVLESDDSAAICRSLMEMLVAEGASAGCAGRNGLAIGDLRLTTKDAGHPAGIRTLLNNPAVEIAILEISAEAIVEQGLGLDQCDAIVLPVPVGTGRPGRRPVDVILAAALETSEDTTLDTSWERIDHLLRTLDLGDAVLIARSAR